MVMSSLLVLKIDFPSKLSFLFFATEVILIFSYIIFKNYSLVLHFVYRALIFLTCYDVGKISLLMWSIQVSSPFRVGRY